VKPTAICRPTTSHSSLICISTQQRRLETRRSMCRQSYLTETANSVPRLIRVADIVWAAAGLSGFLPFDTIRPPTSVYSLPLSLVDQVGGWDAGPEAIGEDLHMYLKCYWKLEGNLISKIVPSAASHTNISSISCSNPIKNWTLSHRARYNQAIRHMWGSLDTGYALQMLFASFWNIER
jgi:hypothetical protein